jgi:hypothetical protein
VPEPDRNFKKGGRSFYFFDFDDNVAFLTTPTFIFHKETGEEIKLSSGEFAQASRKIGKQGDYANYMIDTDPVKGTFRCFRDREINWLQKLMGSRQTFVTDLGEVLRTVDLHWKGPSWGGFYHAVFNQRPVALITARGHHPNTLRDGIRLWVREGHLPQEPNYLGIYPVSHPEVQKELGLGHEAGIPKLKQRALRAAVNKALKDYGYNPHHRFGMSDDDPGNIEWIVKEMKELKREYPTLSFFIIQTHKDQIVKHEVFSDHISDQIVSPSEQMELFDL